MEIALLFSNETGFLDIKEVRLVFQRQSWLPTIESGSWIDSGSFWADSFFLPRLWQLYVFCLGYVFLGLCDFELFRANKKGLLADVPAKVLHLPGIESPFFLMVKTMVSCRFFPTKPIH